MKRIIFVYLCITTAILIATSFFTGHLELIEKESFGVPFFVAIHSGSVFFWALSAISILAIVVAAGPDWADRTSNDSDDLLASGLVVAFFLVALTLFSDLNPIRWTFSNYLLVGKYLLYYILIGGVYVTIRWSLYNVHHRMMYRKREAEFLASKKITSISQDRDNWILCAKGYADFSKASFESKKKERSYRLGNYNTFDDLIDAVQHEKHGENILVGYSDGSPPIDLYPNIIEHKEGFVWFVWWPGSAAWYVFNEFIKDIFVKVYDLLSIFWQKISNWIWSDIHKELDRKPPENSI